jgi:hypothetical protein
MQQKISNKVGTGLIDKLISVAYGDAGIIDKIIVIWKARGDENVKNLLEEYRSTARKVRKMKNVELPDSVIENVNGLISSRKTTGNFSAKISYLFFTLFSRKAVPLAGMVIVVLSVISFLIFNVPTPAHKYTKAEIELAETQLKQSLAIVGKVFTKAEKNFSQDILNKQLNKRLNKGYYLVNNILTGG